MLTSTVDWSNAGNDLDSADLRGRCARAQLIAQAPGCDERAVLATEDSTTKPSVLRLSGDVGEYTLVVFSFGPTSATASYRLESEGAVSLLPGPTSPPPAPAPPPSTTGMVRFLGDTVSAGSTVAV